MELHPQGLLVLLRQAWKRCRLPLIVTGNGVADAEDTLRPADLRAHA